MGELIILLGQRGERQTYALINEAGATLPQWITLNILHWAGPQSVTGIAEMLGLTNATASHLVERLVQARFVERSEDPDDRRLKRVVIPSHGRSLVTKMEALKLREWESGVAQLSTEIKVELERAMGRAVAELKEKSSSAKLWVENLARGLATSATLGESNSMGASHRNKK
jgi:DNA-binding MarR family transcriptional regulator